MLFGIDIVLMIKVIMFEAYKVGETPFLAVDMYLLSVLMMVVKMAVTDVP